MFNPSEFIKTGLYIKEFFIKKELLEKINIELDYYFQEYSMNGSIRCQRYSSDTKIFDQVQFIESVNFYELILDLVDIWKELYPGFERDEYVLTRASFKDEIDGAPILWHTDITPNLFRNIIYLDGGEKNSGQFRYMKGSHKIEHDIEFAMTKNDFEEHKDSIVDCQAPLGSALFFDAKGFHGNYPRIKNRRTLILTWEKRAIINSASRLMLSSSNLNSRVIKNLHYFSLPELKKFDIKDYDFNPPVPFEPIYAFKYFLKSINHYYVIKFKVKIFGIINWILGRKNKYEGSFLVKR